MTDKGPELRLEMSLRPGRHQNQEMQMRIAPPISYTEDEARTKARTRKRLDTGAFSTLCEFLRTEDPSNQYTFVQIRDYMQEQGYSATKTDIRRARSLR